MMKQEIIDITVSTAADPKDTSVQIAWDAAADVDGYRVLRAATPNGPFTQVGETTATAFIDTGLTPDTTYHYQVVPNAVEADAEPAAPQNLTAIAVGPTQIITIWDTVAGASRYNVYRGTTPSGPYTLAGMPVAPPFTDGNLTPNTTYYYHVSAVEGEVESALSNLAAATTRADVPVPTNVVATAVGPTQINTAWNAVPDAMAYAVYRGATPDGTYQFIGTASGPFYSDTGLTPDTTYYYRVAAIISGMEGSQSAYAAATTFPDIPLPAPANVQAQALNCTEILVTWDASPGAEGYHVYRSESAAGPFQLIDIAGAVSYFDTGLTPSATYYYFVQAYAGGQFSVQSTLTSATTPPCGTPVPPCRPCCCPRCGCDPCCCHCTPRHDPCCR